MNDNLLLDLKNLCIDFNIDGLVAPAVKDIHLQIHANEMLALVGESGSGKSVTAMAITQLLAKPPANYSSGEILFRTKENLWVNVLTLSDKELNKLRGKEIGFVFQEPMTSLNPLMTCGEQVEEVLRYHLHLSHDEAKAEVLHWFSEVKLPDPELTYRKYPHELSGGQKQRVMIAMALCCKPSLLIADEPTTALDANVHKSILDLLKELQSLYQIAILFISHDLNLVKQYADHIIVMQKGTIVESAPTRQLFQQPAEDYTKSLLACRASVKQRVKRLQTIYDVLEQRRPEEISNNQFQTHLDELEQKELLLSVQQISIAYPIQRSLLGKPNKWKQVVHDMSFNLRAGETLGLIGESGCGKSSIGKAIVQIVPLQKGNIFYAGKNLANFTKEEIKRYRSEVQIIFQDPYSSLNPRMTIGEAITETMTVHGLLASKDERKNRSVDLLEKVGLLADHYKRYPHEFSGGQRQRICIARTLALQPRIIICDESVSALDVSIQAQVLNLLGDLREEFGLSYLFISHDMAVVKHISDYVLVMDQGRKIEYNDAETLYRHPAEAFTQTLLRGV